MNTKVYGSVLRRRLSFIIIITIIVLILSLVGTALMPDKTSVSLSIAVDVSDQQRTTDYKFSRYYGAEASEKFAETVASWFQSPEVVQGIFDNAEIDPGTTNLRKLAKIFDAEPLAAQNVGVDFTVADSDEADRLLEAIRQTVEEKTNVLNRDEEATFISAIAKPVVLPQEKDYILNGVVGLVVGLIIGVALAVFFEYWQSAKKPE
ncbi:hypothetical protein ACFL2B_02105 [Patescibacteria group bacterium]